MHVVQFFILLLEAPHIEVVEPALPESRSVSQRRITPQTQLCHGQALSASAAQRPRDSLFQHLHDRRGSAYVRLADQQMNVIQHHHIAQQGEVVAIPHLAQNLQEHIARPLGGQKRHPAITAAADEMQVPQAVAAFQPMFHLAPPHPSQTARRVRHPQFLTESVAYFLCGIIPPRADVNGGKYGEKGCATLYDVVGSVKRHLQFANHGWFVFFFPKQVLSLIATKARTVNPAVETGSTNHLFGHSTSDHDSFFRRPDTSGEQAAQSA